MNASKKAAREAKANLVKIADGMLLQERRRFSGQLLAIQLFIEAAERKLPTEKAFKADAKRRKAKAAA